MDDRATDVALFRYSLVRELATAALSKAERGRRGRSLAARTHTGPGGTRITVSRGTIDRWVRALRVGGFEALKPPPRAANPKTPAEVLDFAERLRRERPERSAAHICELLSTVNGWAPDERTIQRHFNRIGLSRRITHPRVAFGRFEATTMGYLEFLDLVLGCRRSRYPPAERSGNPPPDSNGVV